MPCTSHFGGALAAQGGWYLVAEVFLDICLVIVMEVHREIYKPIIQLMQQLAIGVPSSINDTTHPGAPPWSAALSRQYLETLQAHFPTLHPGAGAHQHSQIANQIGHIAHQQQTYYGNI